VTTWAWKLERNEMLHTHVQHGKLIAACAISKSPATAKLLSAKNTRLKSTVNSSQRRQTRWSTRHTILRCDELTGSLSELSSPPLVQSLS